MPVFFIVLISLLNVADAGIHSVRSLCGASDDRVASFEKPVGRITAACTATLISPSCMVTAGHCTRDLKSVQFNFPGLKANGEPGFPTATDHYAVDQVFGFGNPRSKGNVDWAVFRVAKNSVTGKRAGDVQGYYSVKMDDPSLLLGQKIRITGYGYSEILKTDYLQQTASGQIMGRFNQYYGISYLIDTTPGNSGSPIILDATNEVVGVHTDGPCSAKEIGVNYGTAIGDVPEFQKAIQQCIQSPPL